MASEKVTAILRARSSLSEDELATLSEAEAWRRVYSLPARTRPPARIAVCFTGFSSSERDELARLAEGLGHHVTASVTKSLGILVCGNNAGPAKLEKAAEQGVDLMTKTEYLALFSNASSTRTEQG